MRTGSEEYDCSKDLMIEKGEICVKDRRRVEFK